MIHGRKTSKKLTQTNHTR